MIMVATIKGRLLIVTGITVDEQGFPNFQKASLGSDWPGEKIRTLVNM